MNDVETAFSERMRDEIVDGFMKQYYRNASTGHVFGKGGWWGDAEMFETILDAFETTGDTKYKTYFDELYRNFVSRNGTDWSRRLSGGYPPPVFSGHRAGSFPRRHTR